MKDFPREIRTWSDCPTSQPVAKPPWKRLSSSGPGCWIRCCLRHFRTPALTKHVLRKRSRYKVPNIKVPYHKIPNNKVPSNKIPK
jgi:hypothetical protein